MPFYVLNLTNMNKVTYMDAFMTIGKGYTKLASCLYNTMCETARDVFKGAMNHPIFAIIVIVGYVSMFFALAEARVERDKISHKLYRSEISIDSLKLMVTPRL